MRHTDVLIAGDGIAGFVLSLQLEKLGIPHLLLSRQSRKKAFALGETLPPSVLPLLQSMGLLDLFEANSTQRTYGYEALWGSRIPVENNFFYHAPFQHGLKLNKQSLIENLEKEAAAHVLKIDNLGAVSALQTGIEASFQVAGKTQEIRAKIMVDATGRNRFALKKLGVAEIVYDSLSAFSCHLPRKKHPELVHSVFAEAFADAWGIVSALDDRKQVLTLYCPNNSTFQPLLKQYENWPSILSQTLYLKHFLSDEKGVKVVGALANSSRPEQFAGNNWLAVGDAALAFDPLSSHGISNAVFTPKSAAEAISTHLQQGVPPAFSAYDQSLAVIFNAYHETRQALYRQAGVWAEPEVWGI